jgi:hypothetical protein
MTKKTTSVKAKEAELLNRAIAAYSNQRGIQPEKIGEVGLKSIVTVLALIRNWSSEDLSHIRPVEERHGEYLWPTMEMESNSISFAYRESMLLVAAEYSPPSAFVEYEEENGETDIRWYNRRAALKPSINLETRTDVCYDLETTYTMLREKAKERPSNLWKCELPELMVELAVAECRQFYESMLDEYNFPLEVGEKTEMLFRDLLAEQSVSHVLPSIWAAVKSAAAFLQTDACKGRPHAYNSIFGKIQDEAAKRRTGQYKSIPFERGHKCPRSVASMELYGVLGYDEDIGFTSKVTDITLPEEWTIKAVPNQHRFDQDDKDWMFENFNATYCQPLCGFEVIIGDLAVFVTETIEGIAIQGYDARTENEEVMFDLLATDPLSRFSMRFILESIRAKHDKEN